jgi:hypothetical protein
MINVRALCTWMAVAACASLLALGCSKGSGSTDAAPSAMTPDAGAGAGTNAPLSPGGAAPTQQLLLGNRDYITSFFREIFTTAGQESSLDAILREEVRPHLNAFGGACSMYSTLGESDCTLQDPLGLDTNDMALPIGQSSSASREAWRLRACDRILDLPDAIAAAISKIPNASSSGVPSSADISGAFDLFYPGQVPDASVTGALQSLVAESAGNAHAAWQTLLLALCRSPGWQVP